MGIIPFSYASSLIMDPLEKTPARQGSPGSRGHSPALCALPGNHSQPLPQHNTHTNLDFGLIQANRMKTEFGTWQSHRVGGKWGTAHSFPPKSPETTRGGSELSDAPGGKSEDSKIKAHYWHLGREERKEGRRREKILLEIFSGLMFSRAGFWSPEHSRGMGEQNLDAPAAHARGL